MLYIFVAELPTALADSKPYSMTTRTIICARVLGIKGLDRITAFNTDWHGGLSLEL